MRAVGDVWERAAQAELERAGLQLLARNWHCRYGELDLIMRDGDTVVFVEVRYRDDARHGDGLDSIGPAKQRKLIRTAEMFLAAHPQLARHPCRFDSVAFSQREHQPVCAWERAAFDAY